MDFLNLNNFNDGIFYKEINKLYNIFAEENFKENIDIPSGFENLINVIYNRHNKNIKNIFTYELKKINIKENKKDVLIGFSGGLDSSYISLKLKNEGYNVILFHLKNLNKNYPKEDIFAKNFAKNNNFEYIEIEVKHNKKEFFIDNPLKNQLILSIMIDYGIKNNITNFSLGSDIKCKIEDSKIGMTITDSYEVNKYFLEGIKKYFNNANFIFISQNEPKINRIKYIYNNNKNSYNNIYSCITPHRFNNKLHEFNEQKYNIKLLNGRCGSCFKCCMEILLLSELGYEYTDNKELLEHCWKILSDSKNSHAKEMFDKKIPLEIRKENLLKYGY